MKRHIVVMLFVVVVLAATLCFLYIRPGVLRYRYYETLSSRPSYSVGDGGAVPVTTVTHSMRTDRLTGQVHIYQQGKWQKANN